RPRRSRAARRAPRRCRAAAACARARSCPRWYGRRVRDGFVRRSCRTRLPGGRAQLRRACVVHGFIVFAECDEARLQSVRRNEAAPGLAPFVETTRIVRTQTRSVGPFVHQRQQARFAARLLQPIPCRSDDLSVAFLFRRGGQIEQQCDHVGGLIVPHGQLSGEVFLFAVARVGVEGDDQRFAERRREQCAQRRGGAAERLVVVGQDGD